EFESYWINRHRRQRRLTRYSFVNDEAAALVERFATPPTEARKALIDAFWSTPNIKPVMAKLDAFYMLAAADAQSSLLNWVSTSHNLTAVNSPTLEVDRGYTGNGTSAHLTTGAVRNGLSKFTQDSASFGAWERSEVTAGFLIGTATGAIARVQGRIGGVSGGRLNSATGAAAVVATSIGQTVMDRPSSGTVRCLRNGVQNGTSASTSAALTADAIYLLRDAGVYHAGQISAGFIGSALSDAEHLAIYNAVNTYLVAVGAA
ncbi:MAG TPA: hypothetical protein VM512_16970, partial [Burkholderiaceae bacterium]|nr:hypothetical protein [Burkholderiaceae bacterium]